MILEHLQLCLSESMLEDKPDMSKWDMVVDIIHMVFRDRRLPEECICQTVFLIPKDNGKLR